MIKNDSGIDFDINFAVNFNMKVNRQDVRFSYYSVRQPDNSKRKSVDKITHFIINIGNFVNRIA